MQQEGCDADKKNNLNYIQLFHNFIQGYYLSNIHKIIIPNFLHQVLKGLTSKHLIYQIKGLIQSEIQTRKYWGLNILYTNSCGQEILNINIFITTYFAQVEQFTNIIVWDSQVNSSQQTGKIYKFLLQQLVPAIAPLLKQNKGAMLFIQVFTDFIILF